MRIGRLVLASNNEGKLRELREMLGGLGIIVHAQREFCTESAAETGLSFVENAILKARHASERSGLPALADDSGLEVDALHGAPGIRSARYAGDNADDEANNRKLLAVLEEVPEQERGARFCCALALMRHPLDPMPIICTATWEGSILPAPRGSNGFGYDPLFLVDGLQRTSAQLPAARKNRLSHRAQALALLLKQLEQSC